jgi:AcrR family transcriptional regulator
MSENELNTEQLILKAARKVFTHKGFDGTRMQDIADEAGINKALLHYYFRSKDKLFEAIFTDVIRTFFPQLVQVLTADADLFEKVRLFADKYISILAANPDIAGFVFHEISVNPHRLVGNIRGIGVNTDIIKKHLDHEIAAGRIKPIKMEHFIANLVSMCVFPFIAKPVLMGIMQMDNPAFEQFIEERKQLVPEIIINSIRL